MSYKHEISDHVKHLIPKSDKKYVYNFYSVYYINCDVNENFMSWIINQIDLVKDFSKEIHICATTSIIDNEHIIKKFVENLKYKNKIFLNFNEKNLYEYPGIKKVYDLSVRLNSSTDILLYFHSKGVTRYKNYKPEKFYEKILTDIDLIKNVFDTFPSINKIGDRCGGNGWCWYNFWFARSNYISNLVEPVVTERRHYFEGWLGRRKNKTNNLLDCYSLYSGKNEKNIGTYYCPNTNKILDISI